MDITGIAESHQTSQHSFLDFNQPLGLHMDPENRWVKRQTGSRGMSLSAENVLQRTSCGRQTNIFLRNRKRSRMTAHLPPVAGDRGRRQQRGECVNDAYLGAWNAIPPAKPDPLLAYICKIVRNARAGSRG